jgi:hypothetical protein
MNESRITQVWKKDEWILMYDWMRWVKSSRVLCYDRRSVYLGMKLPCGAYDQIFITVRQLRVCWCRALSLTRRRVCRLQLLLVLASAVILLSESLGFRDHISLSQIRLSFRRLLRLSGPRWRYSTPPLHGIMIILIRINKSYLQLYCLRFSLKSYS